MLVCLLLPWPLKAEDAVLRDFWLRLKALTLDPNPRSAAQQKIRFLGLQRVYMGALPGLPTKPHWLTKRMVSLTLADLEKRGYGLKASETCMLSWAGKKFPSAILVYKNIPPRFNAGRKSQGKLLFVRIPQKGAVPEEQPHNQLTALHP